MTSTTPKAGDYVTIPGLSQYFLVTDVPRQGYVTVAWKYGYPEQAFELDVPVGMVKTVPSEAALAIWDMLESFSETLRRIIKRPPDEDA